MTISSAQEADIIEKIRYVHRDVAETMSDASLRRELVSRRQGAKSEDIVDKLVLVEYEAEAAKRGLVNNPKKKVKRKSKPKKNPPMGEEASRDIRVRLDALMPSPSRHGWTSVRKLHGEHFMEYDRPTFDSAIRPLIDEGEFELGERGNQIRRTQRMRHQFNPAKKGKSLVAGGKVPKKLKKTMAKRKSKAKKNPNAKIPELDKLKIPYTEGQYGADRSMRFRDELDREVRLFQYEDDEWWWQRFEGYHLEDENHDGQTFAKAVREATSVANPKKKAKRKSKAKNPRTSPPQLRRSRAAYKTKTWDDITGYETRFEKEFFGDNWFVEVDGIYHGEDGYEVLGVDPKSNLYEDAAVYDIRYGIVGSKEKPKQHVFIYDADRGVDIQGDILSKMEVIIEDVAVNPGKKPRVANPCIGLHFHGKDANELLEAAEKSNKRMAKKNPKKKAGKRKAAKRVKNPIDVFRGRFGGADVEWVDRSGGERRHRFAVLADPEFSNGRWIGGGDVIFGSDSLEDTVSYVLELFDRDPGSSVGLADGHEDAVFAIRKLDYDQDRRGGTPVSAEEIIGMVETHSPGKGYVHERYKQTRRYKEGPHGGSENPRKKKAAKKNPKMKAFLRKNPGCEVMYWTTGHKRLADGSDRHYESFFNDAESAIQEAEILRDNMQGDGLKNMVVYKVETGQSGPHQLDPDFRQPVWAWDSERGDYGMPPNIFEPNPRKKKATKKKAASKRRAKSNPKRNPKMKAFLRKNPLILNDALRGRLPGMSDREVMGYYDQYTTMLDTSADPMRAFGSEGLPSVKAVIKDTKAELERRGLKPNPEVRRNRKAFLRKNPGCEEFFEVTARHPYDDAKTVNWHFKTQESAVEKARSLAEGGLHAVDEIHLFFYKDRPFSEYIYREGEIDWRAEPNPRKKKATKKNPKKKGERNPLRSWGKSSIREWISGMSDDEYDRWYDEEYGEDDEFSASLSAKERGELERAMLSRPGPRAAPGPDGIPPKPTGDGGVEELLQDIEESDWAKINPKKKAKKKTLKGRAKRAEKTIKKDAKKVARKTKKFAKTKGGYATIGAVGGALLLGPIGAGLGVLGGAKLHDNPSGRRRNPSKGDHEAIADRKWSIFEEEWGQYSLNDKSDDLLAAYTAILESESHYRHAGIESRSDGRGYIPAGAEAAGIQAEILARFR